MSAMMKVALVLSIFMFIDLCKSESLLLGSTANAQLAYETKVTLSAIPFTARNKNVFYNDNRVIKAIQAIDLANKKNNKATITSGGIGTTFTNIKLKSGKGDQLNYNIQIFV